ncbi:MAG: hypothetical protein ACRDRH_22435 [Pseudonocardia sp.]
MARPSRPLANPRVVAGTPKKVWPKRWALIAPRSGRWERGEQLPQPWQRPDLAHKLGVTLEQSDDLLWPQLASPDVTGDHDRVTAPNDNIPAQGRA